MSKDTNIEEAAKLLGRQLYDDFAHVVGVSLLPKRHGPGFALYVDIDSKEAPKDIPKIFMGHKVHIRHVGTPRFLCV